LACILIVTSFKRDDMRKVLGYFIIAALLTACASSKKYLERANYDAAITVAVMKLRKNKNKKKEIYVLKEAYERGNKKDEEEISFLRKEGSPDRWDKMLAYYRNLDKRQNMVKSVIPLIDPKTRNEVKFRVVNYDKEIISAKQNAAEFYYVSGNKLMNNNDEKSLKKALNHFREVKKFYANFKDVDKKISMAKMKIARMMYENGMALLEKKDLNSIRAGKEKLAASRKYAIYNDVESQLIRANNLMAAAYYNRAMNRLNGAKGNKMEARKAFGDLKEAKKLVPNYRDIGYQLGRAREMGTTFALFEIKILGLIILPRPFREELMKISFSNLNRQWVTFETRKIKSRKYDYNINLNLSILHVSPSTRNKREYEEKREIQDGTQYVLDGNGNVMKDSLGNDIRVPKYKTISCRVIELHQKKNARIGGRLDFIDNRTNQVIKTDPVMQETFFDNLSAKYVGNKKALTSTSHKKLKPPLPMPSDVDMVLQTADDLKKMVYNIVKGNRGLIR